MRRWSVFKSWRERNQTTSRICDAETAPLYQKCGLWKIEVVVMGLVSDRVRVLLFAGPRDGKCE